MDNIETIKVMDKNAQIERAWQLVLGARKELEHANKVAADKAVALARATDHLKALVSEETIADPDIIARILEVA